MSSDSYETKFLVINDIDTINKVNLFRKEFNFKISVYTANNILEAVDIITNNELDYIFIAENSENKKCVNEITKLLNKDNGQNDCVIILQHHNKPELKQIDSNHILIIDEINSDLFKKLVGYSIVNKKSFVNDNEIIKSIYNDNFITTHDQLTMLPNRLFLLTKIESAIIEAKYNKNTMAIFFMDLDGFKDINDKAGHKTGDILLKEVAQRLTRNTRVSDIVSRHGGDEFVIFLPYIRNKQDADIVANKILETMAEPFYINGESWNVTASIGVSMFPDDGSTAEKLIEYADNAMYVAKDNGKNTIRYFNKELSEELEKKYKVIDEIRQAIVNNDFDVVLQPIHDVNSNDIVSVELFIRWLHPERGVVLPNDFLPYILNTGYINSLGDLIVKKALALYYDLKRVSRDNIQIAINVEARQFINDSFIEHIVGLHNLGVNTKSLVIEVTEDCFKTNFDIMKERFKKLKELGITITLDNFGLGNSSVAQLVQLPIDIIKIDNKLFTENEDGNIIKQGIISLAHSLGKKVTAKRIDDVKRLNELREYGVDYGQGYCYEKPMAFAEFSKYLERVQSA